MTMPRLALLASVTLLVGAACHDKEGSRTPDPQGEPAPAAGPSHGPGAAGGGRGAAQSATRATPKEAPAQAAEPGPAPELPDFIEPPTAPEALKAAWQPRAGTPPPVAALETRIFHGDSSAHMLKALQKVTHKNSKDDELYFLLGQLYLSKLWVSDGLKSFRSAIALNPAYRQNPFLVRAAIEGLGNDSDHGQVQRFLAQDIGRPAVPYLQEVLYGDWRAQVKERAALVLREVQ
jgi:hypothetical protein